jgi:hypothetical protein
MRTVALSAALAALVLLDAKPPASTRTMTVQWLMQTAARLPASTSAIGGATIYLQKSNADLLLRH